MELDPLFLSRLQFALTIGIHFLFPPLTIGLAWLLVPIEWLGRRRNDDDYVRTGIFFGKILGLTFAMGAATVIVMEFQFGLSLYPRMVPSSIDLANSLTIYNASSTPRTLTVMLIVALTGMPLVILYTAYVYRVFMGKIAITKDGY